MQFTGTRYHTFDNSTSPPNVDVYIDIQGDTGDSNNRGGTILTSAVGPNPTDQFLRGIQQIWTVIANQCGWTIRFMLRPGTVAPLAGNNPPLTISGTSLPLSYQILTTTDPGPPNGVSYFKFVTGRGANAIPGSRIAKISYVDYDSGQGYLYEIGQQIVGGNSNGQIQNGVPAHELGHVLGLADRYFDAVYWLYNGSIDRTCHQVMADDWFDANDNDTRDAPIIVVSPSEQDRTRPVIFPIRVGLPMDVPQDSHYDPNNNLMSLMSTGAAVLTPMQCATIMAIGDLSNNVGQYRETPPPKWVALLGPRNRVNNVDTPVDSNNAQNRLVNVTWEAQQSGTGLVWKELTGLGDERYACLGKWKRGRDKNGCIVGAENLASSLGRPRTFDLHGGCGGFTKTKFPGLCTHTRMCYTRRLIHALAS